MKTLFKIWVVCAVCVVCACAADTTRYTEYKNDDYGVSFSADKDWTVTIPAYSGVLAYAENAAKKDSDRASVFVTAVVPETDFDTPETFFNDYYNAKTQGLDFMDIAPVSTGNETYNNIDFFKAVYDMQEDDMTENRYTVFIAKTTNGGVVMFEFWHNPSSRLGKRFPVDFMRKVVLFAN